MLGRCESASFIEARTPRERVGCRSAADEIGVSGGSGLRNLFYLRSPLFFTRGSWDLELYPVSFLATCPNQYCRVCSIEWEFLPVAH